MIYCAFAALLLLTGCHKVPERGVVVESQVLPRPSRVGPANIALKISDADAKPVTGARSELEGDMSHPGMAPVFGEAKEAQPGNYRGRLEFSMAGDWVILLHVTLANGEKLDRQLEVKGVRSN